MIGKVLRGERVDGLLRYLFGPGRANEHTTPHLVASWDGAPAKLEPGRLPDGRRDVGPLTALLEQPVAVSHRPPPRPVWHCSVRAAPGDRTLSDTEWADVARRIVADTGLAPDGDSGACRWVAVRHADDHIHVVVTLARQDGRAARTSNDFYRVGEACRWAERQFGLIETAPRDRTAARTPTRGEQEKAARTGRREPARVTLRREVRTAAASAVTADEFFTRLEAAGVLVRERLSSRDGVTVTGYAVAMPGDRARDGRPIWFGGGKLAPDLAWPRVAERWPDTATRRVTWPAGPGGALSGQRVHLSGQERADVWRHAIGVTARTAVQMRALSGHDPRAAADLAHATADTLAVTARAVEGRHGGPLTSAAATLDRAARELRRARHASAAAHRRAAPGQGLRAVARLIALSGPARHDETTQVLSLLANLALLAEALAELRQSQNRAVQATAARETATRLRAVAHPATSTTAPARNRHEARPWLSTADAPHAVIHTFARDLVDTARRAGR